MRDGGGGVGHADGRLQAQGQRGLVLEAHARHVFGRPPPRAARCARAASSRRAATRSESALTIFDAGFVASARFDMRDATLRVNSLRAEQAQRIALEHVCRTREAEMARPRARPLCPPMNGGGCGWPRRCTRRRCRRRADPGSAGTCAAPAPCTRRRCRRSRRRRSPARRAPAAVRPRHGRGNGACAGTACDRPAEVRRVHERRPHLVGDLLGPQAGPTCIAEGAHSGGSLHRRTRRRRRPRRATPTAAQAAAARPRRQRPCHVA